MNQLTHFTATFVLSVEHFCISLKFIFYRICIKTDFVHFEVELKYKIKVVIMFLVLLPEMIKIGYQTKHLNKFEILLFKKK